MLVVDDVKQLYEAKPEDYGFDAEVFEAFSLSIARYPSSSDPAPPATPR